MMTTAQGLTMIVEHVDTETGRVFKSESTTAHGWESAADAQKHWKAAGSFEAYRNGRITRRPDIGVDERVYFADGLVS